jgi:hypothetical protein
MIDVVGHLLYGYFNSSKAFFLFHLCDHYTP